MARARKELSDLGLGVRERASCGNFRSRKTLWRSKIVPMSGFPSGSGQRRGGNLGRMIEVRAENGVVKMAFSTDGMSPEEVNDFVSWLRRRSKLTSQTARTLSDELKAGWWERTSSGLVNNAHGGSEPRCHRHENGMADYVADGGSTSSVCRSSRWLRV
jgi:hypothetical protein